LELLEKGFLTWPEILQMAEKPNADWSQILGIAWRDKQGQTQLNPGRGLIQDLDSIPYPAWDFIHWIFISKIAAFS